MGVYEVQKIKGLVAELIVTPVIAVVREAGHFAHAPEQGNSEAASIRAAQSGQARTTPVGPAQLPVPSAPSVSTAASEDGTLSKNPHFLADAQNGVS